MNKIIILILIIFLFVSCEKNEEVQLINLGFELTSSEIEGDQLLPTEYTCDGESSTLPLSWRGMPEGTKCFALIMHHEVSFEILLNEMDGLIIVSCERYVYYPREF